MDTALLVLSALVSLERYAYKQYDDKHNMLTCVGIPMLNITSIKEMIQAVIETLLLHSLLFVLI